MVHSAQCDRGCTHLAVVESLPQRVVGSSAASLRRQQLLLQRAPLFSHSLQCVRCLVQLLISLEGRKERGNK